MLIEIAKMEKSNGATRSGASGDNHSSFPGRRPWERANTLLQ